MLEKLKNYMQNKSYLHAYLIILCPLVLLGYIVFDPDLGIITEASFGTVFVNMLLFIMFGVLSACLLWLTAVAFTDYGKYGDMEKIAELIIEERDMAAALYMLSINLKWIAIAIVLAGGFFAMK